MSNLKDQLVLVPIEILRVIPLYNGDKSKLNLFLRKCEYVIDMFKGNEAQNLYLLHTVTSRLVDNAAELLSEREDIETWAQLKTLLLENYSDPRSEDAIAVEFESLKIKPPQSLLGFYNLLQATLKTLISKIDTKDELVKSKKETFYNKMALNVFMYNLPLNLVQILRLKSPNSLEEAYNIVQEEISFFNQYSKKQFTSYHTVPEFKSIYALGVASPFLPWVKTNFGFGSSSQVQSANQNPNSYGSTLFGSVQSHSKSGSCFGSTTSGFGSTTSGFGSTTSGFGSTTSGFGSTTSGFGTQPQSFKTQSLFGENCASSQNPSDNNGKNAKPIFNAFVDE